MLWDNEFSLQKSFYFMGNMQGWALSSGEKKKEGLSIWSLNFTLWICLLFSVLWLLLLCVANCSCYSHFLTEPILKNLKMAPYYSLSIAWFWCCPLIKRLNSFYLMISKLVLEYNELPNVLSPFMTISYALILKNAWCGC